MHVLLYHVLGQMRWLGTSGMLHEGVVEAFHVRDNRHKVRFANVKDRIRNIILRSRAAWQMTGSKLSMRSADEEREERRREKLNTTKRGDHAAAARRRAARLADEDRRTRR